MNQVDDPKLAAQAAADQAIRLLGGPVEAAKKVDAPSYQSVQSWRESGVPARFCRKVSSLTGLALDALRPLDWQEYWPELATPTKEAADV